MADLERQIRSGETDEISLKAPYWNSPTVNARLHDLYPSDDFPLAAVLLAGLAPAPECTEEADEVACRLMLDAIRVSEGSLAKLQLWIDAARQDPRDLIGAAEYPREIESGTAEARTRDLESYLVWVRGERLVSRGLTIQARTAAVGRVE